MAKATAFPMYKKTNGKKSYVVIVAPGNETFKATTTIASVTDKNNANLTWTVHKQDVSNDRKKILAVLHGTRTPIGQTHRPFTDPPDPGIVVITLSDPGTVDPTVNDVPVQYVDDYD